jgi:hypothetical protein
MRLRLSFDKDCLVSFRIFSHRHIGLAWNSGLIELIDFVSDSRTPQVAIFLCVLKLLRLKSLFILRE